MCVCVCVCVCTYVLHKYLQTQTQTQTHTRTHTHTHTGALTAFLPSDSNVISDQAKKRLVDGGHLADYPNMSALANGTVKDSNQIVHHFKACIALKIQQ